MAFITHDLCIYLHNNRFKQRARVEGGEQVFSEGTIHKNYSLENQMAPNGLQGFIYLK